MSMTCFTSYTASTNVLTQAWGGWVGGGGGGDPGGEGKGEATAQSSAYGKNVVLRVCSCCCC